MGGKVGYRPNPAGGSEFWFELPVEPTDEFRSRGSALCQALNQSELHILVVEDVAVNQELAIAMLTRRGHRVSVASNGREAVAAVQQQNFDLVLMDVQMPIMDGITATKLIRLTVGASRDVPIIALTANILPDQVAAFKMAGMDDHVSKPIKIAELTDAIARNVPRRVERSTENSVDAAPSRADFDRAVFDQLAAMLPPDRLLVHLASLQSALSEVHQLDGPSETLRSSVHTMISQAGMFGFTMLSQICRDLEQDLVMGRSVDKQAMRIRAAVVSAQATLTALQLKRAS
jgi:CheY-like chemotaxis protein